MTTRTLAVTYTFDVEVDDDSDPCADTAVLAVEKFQSDERSFVPTATRDIEVIG